MCIKDLWRRRAGAVVGLHIANRSPNLCFCCRVVRYYGVTALAPDLNLSKDVSPSPNYCSVAGV